MEPKNLLKSFIPFGKKSKNEDYQIEPEDTIQQKGIKGFKMHDIPENNEAVTPINNSKTQQADLENNSPILKPQNNQDENWLPTPGATAHLEQEEMKSSPIIPNKFLNINEIDTLESLQHVETTQEKDPITPDDLLLQKPVDGSTYNEAPIMNNSVTIVQDDTFRFLEEEEVDELTETDETLYDNEEEQRFDEQYNGKGNHHTTVRLTFLDNGKRIGQKEYVFGMHYDDFMAAWEDDLFTVGHFSMKDLSGFTVNIYPKEYVVIEVY